MRRIALLLLVAAIGFWFGNTPRAKAEGGIKAAFVRDGNLWIKTPAGEKQITTGGDVESPKWSYDGKWIAYTKVKKQDLWKQQLWVYNIRKGQKHRVLDDGNGYRWAPNKDVLAFLDESVLDIVDFQSGGDHHFENVALGVNHFAWLPDGTGFLASSSGNLLPTGWTTPILFKIPLDAALNPDKIKRFFEIPKDEFQGPTTGTSTFKWSPDKKWMAFQVTPTASLSADSNTLCVLSSDGRTFAKLDEMLNDEEWFKWAPTTNKLGYIAGIGRIALKDKELKVKELPALNKRSSYTPEGYVDRAFTWYNDHVLTVSRARESDWSNDQEKWPLPSLVRIDIQNGTQKTLQEPPRGEGDFYPRYLVSVHKLSWIRFDGKKARVLLGNMDASHESVWIRNIDNPGNYYARWTWDSVLDWYEG